MNNKYFKNAHISEAEFKQILYQFCLDIEGQKDGQSLGPIIQQPLMARFKKEGIK